MLYFAFKLTLGDGQIGLSFFRLLEVKEIVLILIILAINTHILNRKNWIIWSDEIDLE